MEEKLLNIYIKKLEKTFLKYKNTDNYEKTKKLWNKIKTNSNLLEYSSKVINKSFVSNVIVEFILTDSYLYNTELYKKIVNLILSNKELARIKLSFDRRKTFLLEAISNKNLELTKEQKVFLIYEAEECPYSSKYYASNSTNVCSYHGLGIFDIRYELLKNKNFSLQERKNLSYLFYPDEELRIAVLEELEHEISNLINIQSKDNYSFIYEYDLSNIEDKNKRKEIADFIELAKFIKENIPDVNFLNYKM